MSAWFDQIDCRNTLPYFSASSQVSRVRPKKNTSNHAKWHLLQIPVGLMKILTNQIALKENCQPQGLEEMDFASGLVADGWCLKKVQESNAKKTQPKETKSGGDLWFDMVIYCSCSFRKSKWLVTAALFQSRVAMSCLKEPLSSCHVLVNFGAWLKWYYRNDDFGMKNPWSR